MLQYHNTFVDHIFVMKKYTETHIFSNLENKDKENVTPTNTNDII